MDGASGLSGRQGERHGVWSLDRSASSFLQRFMKTRRPLFLSQNPSSILSLLPSFLFLLSSIFSVSLGIRPIVEVVYVRGVATRAASLLSIIFTRKCGYSCLAKTSTAVRQDSTCTRSSSFRTYVHLPGVVETIQPRIASSDRVGNTNAQT
ncbi:hypothetical protein BGZ60DRAFT_114937 [Tricladium varicosporioides]|nr:hypothetical protein BGZ60DRAFT_114937 [Hymenoscyphus varicosporioides]